MSRKIRELKLEIISYLGTERTYWHGNSVRLPLPIELVEKLQLRRGAARFLKASEANKRFLFYETDRGILIRPVDQEMEEKLGNLVGFASGRPDLEGKEAILRELLGA